MSKVRQYGSVYQAGVVDVGAHSIRLDIFEVAGGGRITLLESLSRTVNLGNDVFRRGSVSPENLATLGAVMADFSRKLAEYKVRVYRVVATSAIREAFNRELVMNRVRNDSHLTLEILEAQEEIRITFLSMRETLRKVLPFDRLTGICLMVGSGSLLVTYFSGGLMHFSEEVALGTVRLIDAFGQASFSMEQLMEILRSQDIRQRLVESVGFCPEQPITLVAMGASVRMLAGGLSDEPVEERESEILELSCDRIGQASRRAMTMEPGALAAELDVSEPVAASISACGGILSYFLDEFNCQGFVCPGTTTRSALIHDLVRRSRPGEEDPFHDDLLAVCDAIGHKYGYDPLHAMQVSDLCLRFLEKLRRNFEFPPRSEIILEAAARLHDIGRFVDTRQHHKHSCYLVSNMQLPGISEAEQRVIAAVSRYHRKSGPKESHPEYMMLSAEEKVAVLKLASILRVADALDCSRRERFKRMKLAMRGHAMVILLPESGDYRAERLYLKLKGGMFNEVFGLDLKIEEAALS